jgi:predicted O-methyltransferase YrrM
LNEEEWGWFDFVYFDHNVENYFDDLKLLEKTGLLKHGTTIVAT